MAQWTAENPGAGNTAMIRTLAVNIDFIITQLSEAKMRFDEQGAKISNDAWVGPAADAWRARRDTFATDFTTFNTAAAYPAALTTYAGTVEEILSEEIRLRADKEDAASVVAEAATNLRDLNSKLLSIGLNSPSGIHASTQNKIRYWQTVQDSANERLTKATTLFAGLEDQRRSADTLLLNALPTVSSPIWVELGAAMAAAGITRPELVDVDGVARALDTAAQAVIDGEATPEEIEKFETLLAAWSDDPDVLGAFYERLGGGGTAALVNAIGDEVGQAADPSGLLALAEKIRATLAIGSMNWNDDVAGEFAQDMNESARAGGAIAYLFGDWQAHPMGQNLATAMANIVDERERLDGPNLWGDISTGAGWLANLMYPEDPNRAADPGGAIMGTLAQYPDAAFAWLTDAELGADRVQYWYGERGGHIHSDGFAGVAALWESVFHINGGLDGTTAMDPERVAKWADLTSAIIATLNANPHYSVRTISEMGGAQVSAAVGNMLPLIAERPLSSMPRKYETGAIGSIEDGSIVYGDVSIPFFDPLALARILGVSCSTTSGVVAYEQAAQRAIQLILDATDVTSPDYADICEDSADAIATIYALADGAAMGTQIGSDYSEAVAGREFWDMIDQLSGVGDALSPSSIPSLVRQAADAAAAVTGTTSVGGITVIPTSPDPHQVLVDSTRQSVLGTQDLESMRDSITVIVNDLSERRRQQTGTEFSQERSNDMIDDVVSTYRTATDSSLWNALVASMKS